MSAIALLKRAMLVIEHCLLLKSGDRILVLFDETVEERLVNALASAAAILGAEVQSMAYVPRRWMFEREFCRFGGAWKIKETIPKVVGAAMGAADCVAVVNSDMDVFFSPSLREMLKNGLRVLLLPYIFNQERFLRLMPEIREEILELKEVTERYFRFMDQAQHARITSPGGTDIEMRLGNHKTGCSVGVVGRAGGGGFVGGMELLPAGQISRVPDKGSANGKIVLNRSLMAHEYTKLHEPIELMVKDGYVVEIKGGIEAERAKEFLAAWNDPEIYNVTELGIGTNPRCKFAGIAAPAEDTHTRGQATLAFGNDTHLGGSTFASCHIDSTMWQPSLELDGRLVVERGNLT